MIKLNKTPPKIAFKNNERTFLNLLSMAIVVRIIYTENSPHNTAKAKYAGMFCMRHPSVVKLNMVLLPNTRDTTAPAAEAISNGINAGILTSVSNTSKAKITPAMGLLKTAAIPAAAPLAKSKVRSGLVTNKSFPALAPIALPVTAIGASSPTEPPNPTVNALVIICENVLCRSTCEPVLLMA